MIVYQIVIAGDMFASDEVHNDGEAVKSDVANDVACRKCKGMRDAVMGLATRKVMAS